MELTTRDAIAALPFPEELSVGRAAIESKAIGIGFGALDTLLRGGDPLRHVQRASEDEAGARLSALGQHYRMWWDRHSPKLQSATVQTQDALVAEFTVAVEQKPLHVLDIPDEYRYVDPQLVAQLQEAVAALLGLR